MLQWFAYIDWKNVLSFVSLIVAVPAALVAIHQWIIFPFLTGLKKLWNVISKLEDYSKTLDHISYEFKPNGGNSLRDVMNRLEKHAIVADVKIHSIMNAHQIAVWEADKTGKFTWASNEFLNLLGLSLEQIKGNGWLVGISQEDRDLVFEEWGAAIAQERDFYLTFSVGNNIPIKVLARGAFIKNAQGEINGFVGTLTRV